MAATLRQFNRAAARAQAGIEDAALLPAPAEGEEEEEHATVTVADLVHVTYRPFALTPRTVRMLTAFAVGDFEQRSMQEQTHLLLALTDFLSAAIVDWDLEADDGSGRIVEPSREGMEDVDYRAQVAILTAIIESEQPPKPSGTLLPPRSSATRAPATRATSARRALTPRQRASRRRS